MSVRSLSLLNDIVFKCIFGTEQNTPILRALLNALLDLSGEARIVELEIQNPIHDKDRLLDKGIVLDVKARDSQRRLYNIEVQLSREPAYVARVLYYVARLFGSQIQAGQPYARLAKTIGISLLDFELFSDQEDLHSTFTMYDVRHGRELTDLLELHFIELSKFRRDKPEELRTPFENWLHLLKFSELYGDESGPVPEVLAKEEGIEMLLGELRKLSASQQVRELIEAREKASHDLASRIETAELEGLQRGLQKGLEQGLEKGREQGLEQGREQGLEQGLEKARQEERQRWLEAVRRMRQAGMTVQTIAQLTGLSPEEVERQD
ncbi:MAG: Rpn family recombination-promoting nuclease/putative transposase [Candidatus Riflebacteria bacterium]|nr:Rpn family recombination-promoting nuclease/putative transposase [Candidatus Riflebacteria bacterium]